MYGINLLKVNKKIIFSLLIIFLFYLVFVDSKNSCIAEEDTLQSKQVIGAEDETLKAKKNTKKKNKKHKEIILTLDKNIIDRTDKDSGEETDEND